MSSTAHLEEAETDVYQSVSTTNEVEDKYARNDVARKALLGPLSLVIKCLGFDGTYSLFKAETRGRCISWIATPLLLIGFVVLVGNISTKLNEISGFKDLSWHWGETFILFFIAVHSLASAAFLFSRTNSLFFLDYYNAWIECTRLAEKDNKEKENGDAEIGGSSSSIPRSTASRPVFVVLAFVVFTGATVSASTKYAVYRGHNMLPNETESSPLMDKFFHFEPLLSLWGALLSATAVSVFGILQGILQDTLDDFNKDLKKASDERTLSTRIDSFAVRQQAVMGFARLLNKKMGTFATYTAKPMVVVNFTAMFLSLAFKDQFGGIGMLCVILWTFAAIGSKVCVLLQPAAVQNKLNKSCEILVADKEIWSGDSAVAQQAHIMLTKRHSTDTTVSILKCLKLTPWVANGLMMVPPCIGGALIVMKVFVMTA